MASNTEYTGPNVTTFTQELYPVLIDGVPAGGGLQTVARNEIEERKVVTPSARLDILTNDAGTTRIPEANARIVGGDFPLPLDGSIYTIWFDEEWSMVHPDAFSAVGYDITALKEMFQGEYDTPAGTLERLVEHHMKYGKDKHVKEQFVARFADRIHSVEPGSVVNWQDYFFLPLIEKYGDQLKERHVFQTYHHHMSFPAELYKFTFGKQLLHALSKMDRVYVHTDEDVRRVQDQLTLLQLPVPDVRRFDLGIDQEQIKKGLQEVNSSNYREHPDYQKLHKEQQVVIDEVFRTQGVVPHRFMSLDRMDPQKGNIHLFEGIERYLDSLDMSLEDIQQNYRFFFFMELLHVDNLKQYRLGHQYTRYATEKLRALQEKYPGVVLAAPSVPRSLLPAMSKGVHAMTGGVQDGLNLSFQEILFANASAGEDTNGIMGMGAGFAMQARQDSRNTGLVYFTRVGKVTDIQSVLRDIVKVKQEHPGWLGRRTREISEREIEPRRDTIFVRP